MKFRFCFCGLWRLFFVICSFICMIPSLGRAHLLQDGGFESGSGNRLDAPWQLRNEDLGKTVLEVSGSQGSRTLHVLLHKESDYGKTLTIFQVINVEGLQGKTLTYGGEVKAAKARLFLRLWTPKGDGQIEVANTTKYASVQNEFTVPQDAPYLIFGVEAVGDRGGEIWADNLFVEHKGTTLVKPPQAVAVSDSQLAVLSINPGRRVGRINPLKFGGHLEWINAGHGLWNTKTREVDRQALALLVPLRIPVWRFPGGIYADYYHWQEALAPPAQRPSALDPFDNTTRHRHDLGVEEFIAILKATQSEPLITANYGTGSRDEAVTWLRHFQARGVKARYWEIGNEVYMADPKDHQAANGARIYRTARQYAADFPEWAAALKAVDGDIQVGAIGGINNTHPSNRGWLDTVLKTAGSSIDFLALHNAFAPVIMERYDYSSETDRLQAYRAMLAQVEDFKADIAKVKDKLRAYQPSRANSIGLAITEHFPIFGGVGSDNQDQLLQNIDQSRTMAGALYTASLLIAMVSEPQIFMANYLNPIHPYFSAFLHTSEGGLIRNPVYHVYAMFRSHFGEELLFSHLDGPTFSTKALGMMPAIAKAPLVDAVAAVTRDGVITVALVNRDLQSSRQVTVSITGRAPPVPAEHYLLAGSSPNATVAPPLTRTAVHQPSLQVQRQDLTFTSNQTISLPPASFSILKISPGI